MVKYPHAVLRATLILLLATASLAGTQILFAQGPGQVALPGRNIPKFVDPLPTFVGTRVNGTVPLTVSVHEFQQQVLPSTFVYPAPFTGEPTSGDTGSVTE